MKNSSRNLSSSWKLIALSLTAALFVLSSCGDDDDAGPSRTDLLVGTWEIDEINGVSTSSAIVWEVEFKADGDFEELENLSSSDGSTLRFTGEWEWNSDQTEITLDYDGSSFEIELEVNRLTNEEIEVEESGNEYVFKKD